MRLPTPMRDPRSLTPQVYGPQGPGFDLLVIGGGCNGVGIARDAALRGLTVALVEKDDLGGGATGNSSGMIHGGAKYLLNDVGVTRLCCLDSGCIQRIAPHLLFRIPFIVPIARSRPFAKVFLELVETFFSAYDKFQPLKNGLPHLRLDARELHQAVPGLVEEMAGAVVFDEWGIDPHRLAAANAVSAAEAGAEILLGQRVEGLLQTATGRVFGALVRDGATGMLQEITARVVVNAAGAWASRVAAMAGQRIRLRPAKGVHLIFGRRMTNHAVVATAIDGREIFLMPHGQTTWIGTTDDDYFGDPDDLEVTPDEVEYLLGGIAEILPRVRELPLLDTMAGVRPTLFKWGSNEDKLSRHHEVIDHGLTGASGLVSVVGGKLATYRILAKETVDLICRRIGMAVPCRSHREPLPGAEEGLSLGYLAEAFGLPRVAVQRLAARQGCRARGVLTASQRAQEIVCACSMVTAAEIRYVVRHEWVRDLATLRRRTGLGRGECGGTRCVSRAAVILGMDLGLSPRRVQELLREDELRTWKRRVPVAGGVGVARLARSRMVACAGRDWEA